MKYGFNLFQYTVIERVYDLDLNLLSYMLLFNRDDYPFRVYFKFNSDFTEINEVYPLLLKGDVKLSIDVFKREKTFNESFDFSKYAYLSWDLKHDPDQVYFPTPDIIKRYSGDDFKLDMVYENVTLRQLRERSDVPENIKDYAESLSADYVFLYWKDDKLVKFNIGITMFNSTYNKLRKEVEKKLYS